MGFRAFAGQPAYTAAKHGVIGLTKVAALDHASQGIRINSVAPGFIETPLLGHLSVEKKQAAALLHPMARLGQADEIANVIVFLLSDAASLCDRSMLRRGRRLSGQVNTSTQEEILLVFLQRELTLHWRSKMLRSLASTQLKIAVAGYALDWL